MIKKLLNVLSILQLIIAIVMYFTIAYLFETDRKFIRILSHTDLEATVLRLLIYIIPGINVISGFFGLVFNTLKLRIFTGILEIIAGYLAIYYQGRSEFMYIMGIVMIVIGSLTILLTIIEAVINYLKKRKK